MVGSKSKNMVARALGGFILCVHTAEAPSDAEWDRILALFRAAPDLRQTRVLVYTPGGAPDARQRSKLSAIVGAAKPRIAVLTPSAMARAAGTAISWFIPSIKMYEPDALDRALDHLDATRAERDVLTRALADLRRELET